MAFWEEKNHAKGLLGSLVNEKQHMERFCWMEVCTKPSV